MISKIFLIINKINNKEKLKLIYIIILNVFSTFLEVLSIGLIFPVIIFLVKPFEELLQNKYAYILISKINIENQIQLVLLSLISIFFAFLIKTIFIFYKTLIEGKFIFDLRANIASKLLSNYLRIPHINFNKKNSSVYIQNTINVTNQFIETVILPLITLLPEIFVIFAIIIFLLLIEIKATLFSIIIVLLPAYIFYGIFKSKIQTWGKLQQLNEKFSVFNLNQSLGSAKDIKVYRAEEFFINKFKYYAHLSARYVAKAHVLRILSRHFLELVAIVGLISFIFISLNGNDLDNIIPVLGIFSASIIRLLPSANRIILALQLLRYGKEHTKILDNELKIKLLDQKENKINNFYFDKYIKFSNISFWYNKKKKIFNNLNLTIKKNSIIGVTGVTGSGKSTFVNLLLGLYKPNKGKIIIDNKELNFTSWISKVSYVSQSIVLLDDTIAKNVAFAAQNEKINYKRVRDCCEIAELRNFVESSSKKYNTIVGEKGTNLSGGQIQRIGLARALYKQNSELIILDEATSSLDLLTEKKIVNKLKKLKNRKTIIIISHRKKILELCQNIYKLKNKKLILTS
ncbi:ATP-binding cassette domain-containing protein [Candidatus Pelagibacter sp. HIMB1611]|uniref:ATP-binding cassette domain-containing protein n=1 Tax=unclassified Candidatus Pelagibacter TaxID=2647897 RepID=UPI003F86179C